MPRTLFHENFDRTPNAERNVKRKPVGTAPTLPQLEFPSTDSLSRTVNERLQAAPKGPRPPPSDVASSSKLEAGMDDGGAGSDYTLATLSPSSPTKAPPMGNHWQQPQPQYQYQHQHQHQHQYQDPRDYENYNLKQHQMNGQWQREDQTESRSQHTQVPPPPPPPSKVEHHYAPPRQEQGEYLAPTGSSSPKRRISGPKRKPVGSGSAYPAQQVQRQGQAPAKVQGYDNDQQGGTSNYEASGWPSQNRQRREYQDARTLDQAQTFSYAPQEHFDRNGQNTADEQQLPQAVSVSLAMLTVNEQDPPAPALPPKDDIVLGDRSKRDSLQKDVNPPERNSISEEEAAAAPEKKDVAQKKRHSRLSMGFERLREFGHYRSHSHGHSRSGSVGTDGNDTEDSTEVYDDEEDARYEKQLAHESAKDGYELDGRGYWKYHILKFSKDMYLTTNPDTKHLTRPVAPSYYIDVSVEEETPHLFTLVFNEQETRQPAMTVEKQAATDSCDSSFSVRVHSRDILARAGLNSWVCQAVQVQSELELPNRKRTRCKQYSFRDPKGNEWVTGHRPEILQVRENPGESPARFTTKVRVSSKIFFFLRGSGGPETDTILAVMRKRHPRRKRLLKEGLHQLHRLDAEHQTSRVMDDDANDEKVGWLYIMNSILNVDKEAPWMWPVVVGLVMAVSHNMRLEDYEHKQQFPKMISNIGKRAKAGVRRSFYGGGAHTAEMNLPE